MKAYLTGIKIEEGMFSSESTVICKDYRGKEYSGFFDNNMIKEGMLEVKVLDEKGNLALINPSRGQEFLEARDITVRKEHLKYAA